MRLFTSMFCALLQNGCEHLFSTIRNQIWVFFFIRSLWSNWNDLEHLSPSLIFVFVRLVHHRRVAANVSFVTESEWLIFVFNTKNRTKRAQSVHWKRNEVILFLFFYLDHASKFFLRSCMNAERVLFNQCKEWNEKETLVASFIAFMRNKRSWLFDIQRFFFLLLFAFHARFRNWGKKRMERDIYVSLLKILLSLLFNLKKVYLFRREIKAA